MSLVGLSGNIDIDGILWGVKWDGASITYAFPNRTSQYIGYAANGIQGFQAFNATQRAAVTSIIDQLNKIVNLQVDLAANPANGNLRFAEASSVDATGSGFPEIVSTAFGTPPDEFLFPAFTHGDMFFNSTDYNKPVKGDYAYHTLIHEMGHALGLKHGHIRQLSPDGSFLIPKLQTAHDSMEFSVMTYRSYVGGSVSAGYGNEQYGFAQSWMMNDIAALQYLYGADFTTNSGNTTYSWNSNTGEMFIDGAGQGAPGANRVFLTIWDGNGIDTYDMSNYTTGVSIDLNPGSFSITSNAQRAILDVATNVLARGNVFNALLHDGDLRSLIENAIGGRGSDDILGNIADNVLRGNRGLDSLGGGEGTDSLFGGAGGDTLDGGDGNDKLTGNGGPDNLTGGGGDDTFFYKTVKDGNDTIADFSSFAAGNDDHFEFARSAFGSLPAGALDAIRFQSSNSASAQTADVRFFYEEDTHILRYDQDGSGGAFAAVVIATLSGIATVTADDIMIV